MKKREQNLETLLAICFGLLVCFLIFKKPILIIIAVIIAGIGIFSDSLSAKITWFWLKIAQILGNINGKILLSLIFFVFLTPIAFLMKLLSKNASFMLDKSKVSSLFTERNHTYVAKDLENIW
jgi:hypothetical protein